MFKLILKVLESKLNSIDIRCKFLIYERKLLQEFCQIFDFFEYVILLVQQGVNVSVSLIIFVMFGIKYQFCQIFVIYSNKMIQSFIYFVELKLFLFEKNEIFIIVVVLDLRFKMRWCKLGKVEEIIVLINEKLSNLNI